MSDRSGIRREIRYLHRRLEPYCPTIAAPTDKGPARASSSPTSTLPLAALGLVVVLWGAGPVVTKLITVHPLIGVCARFVLSIPLLYAIVALRGRRVDAATYRAAALPGLAFGVNLIFVFAAVQEVAVAVLSVLVALQPAVLLVVAGRLLGERATRVQVGWTLIGVAGTAVLILGADDDLRASPIGIGYGLLSLATFMVYFVLTRRARATTDVDPVEWMTAINVWSLVAALVPSVLIVRPDDFDDFAGDDLFWLFVLAYLTGVAGHVLMSWVHGFVEASRSALYLLGMNVVAIAMAWPVHDEPVNVVQIAGGLVVLIAVASVIRLPAHTTADEVSSG
ncbi:MAG: DMT family transporter [Actinomycetota bacterium]